MNKAITNYVLIWDYIEPCILYEEKRNEHFYVWTESTDVPSKLVSLVDKHYVNGIHSKSFKNISYNVLKYKTVVLSFLHNFQSIITYHYHDKWFSLNIITGFCHLSLKIYFQYHVTHCSHALFLLLVILYFLILAISWQTSITDFHTMIPLPNEN